MATIAQIRAGLSTRLATIANLRTSDLVLGSPNPPQTMIGPPTILYDETLGGSATYTFPIVLVVARASDRAGQIAMDSYLEPSGTSSVAAAIHADPTLGGIVNSTKVTQGRALAATWGDVEYLQAEYDVEVFA